MSASDRCLRRDHCHGLAVFHHAVILHCDGGLDRRVGHADQNEKRDDGPDDLDRRVLVELLGLTPRRLAVPDDGAGHGAEHHHEDPHDDPHHQRVQIVDLARDDGLRFGQVELVGCCRPRCEPHRCGCKQSEPLADHAFLICESDPLLSRPHGAAGASRGQSLLIVYRAAEFELPAVRAKRAAAAVAVYHHLCPAAVELVTVHAPHFEKLDLHPVAVNLDTLSVRPIPAVFATARPSASSGWNVSQPPLAKQLEKACKNLGVCRT